MTGRRKSFDILILLIVILGFCEAKISDKRLCFDEDCSEVISHGKTTLPYNSKDYDIMSFPSNVPVKIFSKHAGKRPDLWGVEIRGKRGYVPSKFIKETKVIRSKLEHEVPTEEWNSLSEKNASPDDVIKSMESNNDETNDLKQNTSQEVLEVEDLEDKIDPNLVTPTYESIHDGTIPPEIEDVEPPTPSLSTQILEEPIQEEDSSNLENVPNILSSTFSVISDIWNGSEEEEDDENENKEINSSEEDVKEEIIENDKSDYIDASLKEPELQLKEEKKPEAESNIILPDEDKKPDVKLEVFPSGNNDKLESESEVLFKNNDKIVEVADQSPEVTEIPKPSSEEIILTPDAQDSVLASENINNDTGETLVEPVPNESISDNKTESLTLSKTTETVDEKNIHQTHEQETVISENPDVIITTVEKSTNILENTPTIDNIPDTILNSEENFGELLDNNKELEKSDFQKNIVPKQDETVIVSNNAIKSDIIDESAEKTLLDKSEIGVNETFDKSIEIDETINSKVPSNDENLDKSVKPSSENFIPHQESFEMNILENHNTPVLNKIDTNSERNVSDVSVEKTQLTDDSLDIEKKIVVNDVVDIKSNNNEIDQNNATSIPIFLQNDSIIKSKDPDFHSADSSHEHIVDIPTSPKLGEFLGNRNLLNAAENFQYDDSAEIIMDKIVTDEKIPGTISSAEEADSQLKKAEEKEIHEVENLSNETVQTETSDTDKNINESKEIEEKGSYEQSNQVNSVEKIVIPMDTCEKESSCIGEESQIEYQADEKAVIDARKTEEKWNSKTYEIVFATAVTILSFCLGVYFLENKRRDAQLIAKINDLEKYLMITKKKCLELDTEFQSTKSQLDSTVGESNNSKETVSSLKDELAASEKTRAELEETIASLEKELETTSEAGLELERMLREMLASQNEANNPLDQSIEDLQVRLNDQQKVNDSLKNALAQKTRENETLNGNLAECLKNVEHLQTEVTKLADELQTQKSLNIELEQSLTDQVQTLELEINSMTEEKSLLRKQLKKKDSESRELLNIVDQGNSKNIDFEKLYDVAHIKAEVENLLEERDELKIKLNEKEGAHQILEEHVKTMREEVATLAEQCRIAEKDKKEAETRLEVLTKFFEEKEAQRQKEEALWLEKQGEVSSTVERIHTMKNEILNYKQQIELLKREILDQEREYKNQMSTLETKAHEQWLTARQNERRLEEVKAECSQLRNRLTLVEKNISDDSEGKLHRLQNANGEPVGPPHPHHPLYVGVGETSSSPLMFGSGGPVPPPPSHMFMPPPPFLPPPLPPPTSGAPPVSGSASELVTGSRPPPLGGGRLSSPPPPGSGSTNNPAGSPPPLSPPLPLLPPLPHFPHPLHMHRSPPPFDHHHMPPPPLYSHPHRPPPGDTWGDHDTLPMPPSSTRNSTGAFHPHQRDPRARNHKGSLHSSGESLDKQHSGKV